MKFDVFSTFTYVRYENVMKCMKIFQVRTIES